MHKMPLFYFPSTVVWVDDSAIFLQSIKFSENEFEFDRIKTFENPLDSLKYLQSYASKILNLKFLSVCDKYEESDLVDHQPVDINFEIISRMMLSTGIEDEVSVLIVDYDMPEMKGTELCRRLEGLPCKKILLTGAVSEKEVVLAFNDGIIDCYIRKNGESFIEEINTYVKLLTEKYFSERSAAILSHLEASKKLHFSDPAFVAFFSEWCQKNNILKYFIVDKFGNIRTINHEGKSSYFVIYNNHKLNEFISLNSIIDESNVFLKQIASKKKLPFFGEGVNGWDVEIEEWKNHLFPCDVMKGQEDYYWCVVNS